MSASINVLNFAIGNGFAHLRMLCLFYRFGKPLVLDMGDADMMNTVTEKLDEVEKGLMESVMDRSIVNEDR